MTIEFGPQEGAGDWRNLRFSHTEVDHRPSDPIEKMYSELFRGHRMHNIAEGRGTESSVPADHPGVLRALSTLSERIVDQIERSSGTPEDTLTPPEVLFPVEFSYREQVGYACLVRLTNVFGNHLIPTSRGFESLENPALLRISSLPGEPGAIITHVLHENDGFDEAGQHLIEYFQGEERPLFRSSFLETVIEGAALELTGNQYQFLDIEAEFDAIRALRFEAVASTPPWVNAEDAPRDGLDVFKGSFIRNANGKFIAKVRFNEVPERFLSGGSEYER